MKRVRLAAVVKSAALTVAFAVLMAGAAYAQQPAPAPAEQPAATNPAPPPAPSTTPSATTPPATTAAPTTPPAAAQPAAPAPQSPPDAAAPPATPPSATPVAPPTTPDLTAIDTTTLPRDLSPWGMFLAADNVVKAVIIGLALASVICWTVWLAKTLELMAAHRRVARDLSILNRAASLGAAIAQLRVRNSAAAALARTADMERQVSENLDSAGIKERVALRLERLVAGFGRRSGRGLGVLATIGATAPFVGLFGTVWGIMNSFIGISKAHTTNLAVVAPGIAEALLATALGLVAAIPAVVIYNMFARKISAYRARVGDAAAQVLCLIGRDLDRDRLPGEESARSPMIRPAAE